MSDKIWMTSMEVAKALGYCVQRVYQLANEGTIPCEWFMANKNKIRRFRREEIDKILRARRFNLD